MAGLKSILNPLLGLTLLALTPHVLPAASASEFPSMPIRFVVPFAAGGTLDVAARVIGAQLSTQIGQPVVIDNRPGANGIIGTEAVAQSSPDGHTVLFITASFVINPTVQRGLPFDVIRDFTPVAELGRGQGYIVVVPATLPVKDLGDFIEQGKRPGVRWNYSSPGYGNTLHLAGEVFNLRTGSRFEHVPYKGVAPAVNAVVSGEVQLGIMPPLAGLGHVKAGKITALAFTGSKRTPELPDVPTVEEAGFGTLGMEGSWLGTFVRSGTPRPVVERLEKELAAALATPKVAETLRRGGYEPASASTAAFATFVKEEVGRYADLVKELKIEAK